VAGYKPKVKTVRGKERAGARDDEPLFPKKAGGVEPLNAHALAVNFRLAAEKMGYTNSGAESSPFRPKRFRHLFRTACSTAGIDPGFTEAMMGHKTSISAGYLEKPQGLFLKTYLRVEPYLTVFGAGEGRFTELSGEVRQLREQMEGLDARLRDRDAEAAGLYRKLEALREQYQEGLARFNSWAEDTRRIVEEELTAFAEELEAKYEWFQKADAGEKGKGREGVERTGL